MTPKPLFPRLLGALCASCLVTSASAAVLFSDTFNRPNSTDLNASTDGKSGDLGALNWSSGSNAAVIDINNNTLRVNNDASDGTQGGWAWPDHNFVGLTEFTVTTVISEQNSGGNGRFAGFRIGQSLADIAGETSSVPGGNAADVGVYYDNVGTTRGIQVHEGGTSLGYFAFPSPAAAPDTLSATFTFANMNAGTVLNYEVFFNGNSVMSDSTTWSGTNENYINWQAGSTNNTRLDTFTVEGTVIPEPSTFALFGLGLLALGSRRRRAA